MSDGRRIDDEQARRLWERAAQLQAEEIVRRERRERDRLTGDAAGGTGGPLDMGEGHSLDHVRQAAVEAGIAPEFLERALLEADLGRLAPASATERFAGLLLGDGALWLDAELEVGKPPQQCLASLRRITEHLELTLVDSRGDDPAAGGLLVFEAPGYEAMLRHKALLELYSTLTRELHFVVEPLDGDRCRISVRTPLHSYRKTNTSLGMVFAPVFGLGAGGVAYAVTLGSLATGGLAAVLTAGAALVAVGGGTWAGTIALWRASHRYGVRTSRRALGRILQMIATDARTGGMFELPRRQQGLLADTDATLDGLLG